MAEKILIVDDDEELRSELRDFLDGYQVLEAPNGLEALKLVKQANEIAVVILDIRMPGPSGLEILPKLKMADPGLGIIILTGFSSKDAAVSALRGHADDYFEKPIDVTKIKQAVEHLLQKQNGLADLNVLDIKQKMECVRQFITRNCTKKTSLEAAAEAVALSPKYLSRIFKQETGVGFAEYRSQIKIEKAKEWLEHEGFSVNQVAEKLGYESPEAFIRQFKKNTRLTPARYRRKMQSRGASHPGARNN